MSEDNFKYTMIPIMRHDFFWITFTGEVNISRLFEAHDAFTSHPEYRPGIDELLDFTASSIAQMTKKEIELIREYMIGQPGRHNSKSVIVVNTQVEFGLGRMMGGSIAVDVPVERWICYSLRDALEWLRPGHTDELLDAHLKASGGAQY
jgi:hypothetical protein